MATKTLYVGNIPYTSTEQDLLDFFASYGATVARIIEGRGFAFVDVEESQADQAILEKNNSEMSGRRLTVNEAKPKVAGGGRDFGGGANRGYGGDRGGYDGGNRDRDFGGGHDRGDRGRGGRDRGGRGRF